MSGVGADTLVDDERAKSRGKCQTTVVGVARRQATLTAEGHRTERSGTHHNQCKKHTLHGTPLHFHKIVLQAIKA
jgi:hypothetical protein